MARVIGGILGVLFVLWLIGSWVEEDASPAHPPVLVDVPSTSANSEPAEPEPVEPEPTELTSAWENSPGLREWVTEWGRLLGVYRTHLERGEEKRQLMLRDGAAAVAADDPEGVIEAADFWGCATLLELESARRAYLDGGAWLDQLPVGVDPVSFDQRFRVARLQFAESGEALTAEIDDMMRQLADVPVECPDYRTLLDPEQRKASRQRFFDEFRDRLERDGELESFRQEFYEEFGEFPE